MAGSTFKSAPKMNIDTNLKTRPQDSYISTTSTTTSIIPTAQTLNNSHSHGQQHHGPASMKLNKIVTGKKFALIRNEQIF